MNTRLRQYRHRLWPRLALGQQRPVVDSKRPLQVKTALYYAAGAAERVFQGTKLHSSLGAAHSPAAELLLRLPL